MASHFEQDESSPQEDGGERMSTSGMEALATRWAPFGFADGNVVAE
jgi:hypothetical protein